MPKRVRSNNLKPVRKAKFGKPFFEYIRNLRYDRATKRYFPLNVAVEKYGMRGTNYYYRQAVRINPIFYFPYTSKIVFSDRQYLFETMERGRAVLNKPKYTFINLMFNPQYSYDWVKGVDRKGMHFYSFSRYPDWDKENRYLRFTITCYFIYKYGYQGLTDKGLLDLIMVRKIVFVYGSSVRNVIADGNVGKKIFNLVNFYFRDIVGYEDNYVLLGVFLNRIDVGFKCRFKGLPESELKRISEFSQEYNPFTYSELKKKLYFIT